MFFSCTVYLKKRVQFYKIHGTFRQGALQTWLFVLYVTSFFFFFFFFFSLVKTTIIIFAVFLFRNFTFFILLMPSTLHISWYMTNAWLFLFWLCNIYIYFKTKKLKNVAKVLIYYVLHFIRKLQLFLLTKES